MAGVGTLSDDNVLSDRDTTQSDILGTSRSSRQNKESHKEHTERNALRADGATVDESTADATRSISVTNFFMATLFFTVVIVFAAYSPKKKEEVEECTVESPESEIEEEA